METAFERNRKLIEEAQGTCSQLNEAMSNLKRLESEVQELIERLRWHLALGYDAHTAEFIENLDLAGRRDPNH